MRNILQVCICLGILGATIAQNVTTSGASGSECGNNHRCLSTATCSADKSLCVCPPGLVGNAKLGCVKPGDGAIYIQDDPHLKNLFNEYLSVKTPCRYPLIEYRIRNIPIGQCSVEVFADQALYKGGVYYVNRVGVIFHTFAPTRKHLAALLVGKAENGIYKFEEYRKRDEQVEFGFPNEIPWEAPTPENSKLGGLEVTTEYDYVDNFVNLTAEACGISLRFRPADISKVNQTQIPGMVVALDGSLLDKMEIGNPELPPYLSSTPTGPSLIQQAISIGMGIEKYVLLLTLEGDNMVSSWEPECDNVKNTFQRFCFMTIDSATQALDLCADVYQQEQFLTCLANRNISEDVQPHIFAHCVQSICQRNPVECRKVKREITEKTGCDIPSSISSFNCSSLGA